MKARPAIAALIAVAVLSLGACSAGGERGPDASSTTPAIEVEEAIATVDIRLPRTLIDQEGVLADEQIVDAAEQEGISAVIDGDAVVYTMTRAQQADMLAQMRASAQTAADGLIADETNSVTAVEFNEAMTSFKVHVDAERYGALESLLALGFCIQGALFQQFSGVGADDVDVVVEFVDDATEEVLDSGSYEDMRERVQ
ncbi:hypothetical protein [Microbacterium sp. BDGP8]|uniref:hypothetical protein n=1 Tax=Microbacterium sp. BDGP8 TaxID=3035531 RepID=UPI00249F881F|nr:hypothetical protein [Microbacterium sp. BDGP8]WHE35071.1 hypothetical protein P6897_10200 [Microbacterium sp. BDGP8]